MPEPLFRQEALCRQGERLWGSLLLSQPLSFTLLTGFVASLVVLVLVFLASQDYVRKQRVNGLLVPDQGLIDIRAPQAGLLGTLAVGPDQAVPAGAPLFTLQLDHTLAGNDGLTVRLQAELARQQLALRQRRADRAAELALELQRLDERRQYLQARLQELQLLAGNARALLNLKDEARVRAARLLEGGLQARADHDAVQAQYLQQQAALLELGLQQSETSAEHAALTLATDTARLNGRQQLQQIDTELAELHKQQLRLGAEQHTNVVAPLAGTVTAVMRQRGMTVAAQETVLSLLPAGARLEAQLLLPSSAIGFVVPGQRVTLRYAAFPYQKFGVQHARISAVPGSAEPGPEAGGGSQPLYRVSATLERQSVSAYGNEEPLRPGMLLTADIELDQRSLLEWLLEPLFSIRGTR